MLTKKIILGITILTNVSIIKTGEILQNKLAFLQGLHHRVGAASSIQQLPLLAIQMIFEYLPHNRRIQIDNASKPALIVKISDTAVNNIGQSECLWQGRIGGLYTSSLTSINTLLHITPIRISIYGIDGEYCGTIYLTSDQVGQTDIIRLNYRLAGITITYKNGRSEVKELVKSKIKIRKNAS